MRDKLFRYLVEFGHERCYLQNYSILARRISNTYTGVLMVISAGGIVTLSCWDRYPVILALITVLAQILQVVKPLTQSSKQRQALQYIIQDYNDIFDDICSLWDMEYASDAPAECSKAEIEEKILGFKQRAKVSKKRYAADIDFPFMPRIDNKAKKANAQDMWYNYEVKIEEEYNAREQIK